MISELQTIFRIIDSTDWQWTAGVTGVVSCRSGKGGSKKMNGLGDLSWMVATFRFFLGIGWPAG